jgi:arylsulfatase A-like enzyme
LQAVGYHTAYFGKWNIERSNRLEEFGWALNRCKAAEHHRGLGRGQDLAAQLPLDPDSSRYTSGPPGYNRILHYGVTSVDPRKRYPQHTIDQVLEFLGSKPTDHRPWCVCASFSEPNESLVVSRSTLDRYDVSSIELPANLADNLDDRPGIYRRQRQISEEVTLEQWRMARACYLGRITELDDQFGRLLDYLEQTNQIENTLIVLTADHGRYVGAHGFDAHNFGAFEEIYRIPLIVAGGHLRAGERTEALVNLIDLCPTILDLAEAEPIEQLDGHSLMDVLYHSDAERDFRETYAEYFGTRFRLTQRILWRDDWKYVFNGFDFDELYDLRADPAELRNLATDPRQHERCMAMMERIWQRVNASGDRTLAETHYYSMRFALVGPHGRNSS